MNDLLDKENFVTHDWDLKTQKTPPEIEDAARIDGAGRWRLFWSPYSF